MEGVQHLGLLRRDRGVSIGLSCGTSSERVDRRSAHAGFLRRMRECGRRRPSRLPVVQGERWRQRGMLCRCLRCAGVDCLAHAGVAVPLTAVCGPDSGAVAYPAAAPWVCCGRGTLPENPPRCVGRPSTRCAVLEHAQVREGAFSDARRPGRASMPSPSRPRDGRWHALIGVERAHEPQVLAGGDRLLVARVVVVDPVRRPPQNRRIVHPAASGASVCRALRGRGDSISHPAGVGFQP
jgi:hypothetical protein